METVDWGNNWRVSRLCFGALPMGPAQKNLPPELGGRLIREALELGVNFIDTAQSYRTYEHIRAALNGWTDRVYIATKSSASTYEDMESAVHQALSSLGRDRIEVFHLHAARAGEEVFSVREGALACLVDMRERGLVERVGIATHSARVVALAATRPEIDVVFPLINIRGLGVLDGDRGDMESAIARAHGAGKRLYAMKVYGGGNLLEDRRGAMEYAMAVPGIDVVAVGMVAPGELAINMDLVAGREPDQDLWQETAGAQKRLLILSLCQGCGQCLEECPNQALQVDEGLCRVDPERCILCGYCAPGCPRFAIRMV